MMPTTDQPQNTVATGILVGVSLLLGSALLLGLTSDVGDRDWKVRAKLIALAGGSFFPGALSGPMLIGLALVLAVMLARTRGVAGAATALGVWTLLVTCSALVADLSFLAETNDGSDNAAIAAIVMGDLGALVMVAATTWWAATSVRS